MDLSRGSAAWFKFALLERGVAVAPAALARIVEEFGAEPLTLADYATTSGISLILDRDIYVNAPIEEFNANFVANPPFVLDRSGDALLVRDGVDEIPARFIPVPSYHDQKNAWGESYTSYAYTHTDRVRISPVEGCAYTCTFCDLPYKYRYRTKRIEGLLDSVDRALNDPVQPASHVLVSGGVPRGDDFGYLKDCYRKVAQRFPDISVDIMMVPAPGLLDTDELAELGINQLSINLELYSDAAARRIMPRKAKLGLGDYLRFIDEAIAKMGPGRVRSLLLVGLEPAEETLKGVEALAERGCEPVLSPFRPDPATPLGRGRGRIAPPDKETIADVFLRATEIVERYGMRLGPRCIPCMHNTITLPDDSGFYMQHGHVRYV